MKVLVMLVEDLNKVRIEELIASVASAFAQLSPKAVREASLAFVENVRKLGLDVCVLAEDEWKATLSAVRKHRGEFRADYVLSPPDVAALCQAVDDVPQSVRQIVAAAIKNDCGIAWLPMDEEVLDGIGL